ncbi:bucentaur or craniofacial development-domain-containing protein [Dichotomopilus funicola]|uniref:SWR1-complex protein 5 n=1 Tax=Dichotomopilus funicola TaxID=1934379 RepID=A0AAN6ZJL1_9PEZI|nr:bucentaur or craniofacial development-domain-containing protein [Dichotomopilus funicola]
MSADPVHDEDYASEEDSDFAPDDAPAEESSVSEDEDEGEGGEGSTGAGKQGQAKRKRPVVGGDDTATEDAGLENSGDEAIIERGKRRQKKSKRKDTEAEDDEGGEGGLIKTRRMRAAEKEERRTAVASGPVTIDVDALWAQMTSGPVGQPSRATDPTVATTTQTNTDGPAPSSQPQPPTETPETSDLIRIKRTYNFAGKVHTEEKLVARDSAEAKLYLAEHGDDPATLETDDDTAQKRMPRKAFRSIFEPVAVDGTAIGGSSNQRTDLNLSLSERLRAREQAHAAEAAKKLNTVEKSRMDWAGFVDREGIQDELALAGKSKHSFAARQDFLARSEALREDEARRLRMAGRA